MVALSFNVELKQCILDKISASTSRALIGRFVGYLCIRGSFRDWINAALHIRESRIEDILLLAEAHPCLYSLLRRVLLEQSPFPCNEQLLYMPGDQVSS